MAKLFVTSIFTLGLLFLMFLALFLTFLYILGILAWYLLLGLTLFTNFLFWLIGPFVQDWVYKFFYKLQWIGIEGLEEKDSEVAQFVRSVCKKYNMKIPKIGFIDDDNPTSFTYGSDKFNARIVFTKGILTYLKTNERKTVFGHELGHVVHRDFIVMAVASVIVQLFYELYRISIQVLRTPTSGKGGGGKAFFIIPAVIGYAFYFIGTYIMLYLSRVREYFADEFSAQETEDPNGLSMALIKIAYGLVKNPETKGEMHLLKSTRAYNIFDFKIAKTVGLAYVDAEESNNWKPVEGAILFDRLNPWAFVYELSSTHPLTGKRIGRLGTIAESMKEKPLFDVDQLVSEHQVDMKKMYENFGSDLFFVLLPWILSLGGIGAYLLFHLSTISFAFTADNTTVLFNCIGILLSGIGIGYLFKTLYSYSTKSEFAKTDILNLMDDIYTSPIKGIAVELDGKIIGRGIPGLIFSEDMMLQDKTGLIYLNYEGLIPLVSNLIFALTKVKNLIGENCQVEGWFVRGLSHWIELNKIVVDGKEIKSRVRILGILSSFILIVLGVIIFAYFNGIAL